MRIRTLFFGLFAAGTLAAVMLGWGSTLQAATEDVSVKAGVDRATLTIGDPVEYTITVRHRPDVEIVSSLPAPDAEVLKVKEIQDIRQEDGGMIIEGKKFTMTTFRLGDFVLEPVTVEYKTAGGEAKSVETAPIYLKVKSIDQGKEKVDIRGIKTVRSIKGSNVFPVITAILGVVAVGFFIWMIYFVRRDPSAPGEQAPELTPEEEALKHLVLLFESDLLRKNKTREYFFRMSEILKRYFERRVEIPAGEATTYEILSMLREKNISEGLRDQVRDLLENTDFVKFAKWVPPPPQIIEMNRKAKLIVEGFSPKQTEPGSADVQ